MKLPSTTAAPPPQGGNDSRRASIVVRPLDRIALKLGEGDEGHDLAAVDVGARDSDGTVIGLRLHDFQNTLGAGRPDRDDHRAASLELLQQRRRYMINAACHDNLV